MTPWTVDGGLWTQDFMNDAPPLPAVQTFGLTRFYGSMAALSGLELVLLEMGYRLETGAGVAAAQWALAEGAKSG